MERRVVIVDAYNQSRFWTGFEWYRLIANRPLFSSHFIAV